MSDYIFKFQVYRPTKTSRKILHRFEIPESSLTSKMTEYGYNRLWAIFKANIERLKLHKKTSLDIAVPMDEFGKWFKNGVLLDVDVK